MKFLLLQPVQWAQVGIVIGIFAAISVLLTVCILLVAKFCKTNADEKMEKILENLAGANCGGCGCTGCAGFAAKLCKGEATLADCHVTGDDKKEEIAKILGVTVEASKPTVSVCRCAGGKNAADKFVYSGAQDCAEEAKLDGGAKACKYGCLGDGNCERVCPESAISLPEGCACVDPDRCTSCGACIRACPKDLFMRIPADAKVYVACANHDRGKAVMDVCSVGCIALLGCGFAYRNILAGYFSLLPARASSVCLNFRRPAGGHPRGAHCIIYYCFSRDSSAFEASSKISAISAVSGRYRRNRPR